MESAIPIQNEIVLIGGGHAHVAVLRSFGMHPIPGVRLTLISPDNDTPYSGMLPGFLAGHYTFSESHINLLPLCQFAQAQFYRDSVVGLDLDNKKVHCRNHSEVGFDFLSIDTGSTPVLDTVPGAQEFAVPVKPVKEFLERWEAIERSLESDTEKSSNFTIVGAGAGGVELTLSLHHRLLNRTKATPSERAKHSFTLVTASQEILSSHDQRVQASYTKVLRERSIAVRHDFRVKRVDAKQIHDEKDRTHSFDHLFWVTHASAPSWPKEAGLEVDARGFIAVNDCLQSVSHPFVFAAGDVASMVKHPRPKSGVFAVRQGPPLTENLRRSVYRETLTPYHPQKRFLSLISTGDQYAIASKGKFMVQGAWVWRWKDQIDRRFMKRYQEFPSLADKALKSRRQTQGVQLSKTTYHKIRCTGCGSKIGSNILERVLSRLEIATDPSVAIGLSSPDDAAVVDLPGQSPLIQTVDYFPAFLSDPWLFAQIAAIHCLSDILAMGATPHSAQIVVTLPYGLDACVEETLFQTMTGALKVLDEHQTKLIGGHTLEGEKLALGMTINGIIPNPSSLMRKAGLQPGDRLILTKPIGTGIILAATMQEAPPSQWLSSAIEVMLQSNRDAIPILKHHRVTSATDLTGFGLLGHLTEMLQASEVSARLNLDQIPILKGALVATDQGIKSSLYPQNERFSEAIQNRATHLNERFYPTLFDPQTSGGLIFGVAELQVESCLRELRRAGYTDATEIGEVETRQDGQSDVALRA